MLHSPFADAFGGATLVDGRGALVVCSLRELGALDVKSGVLCACDPFTTSFDVKSDGFARRAPVGTFPVEVAIARFPNGDERVACARVRFSSAEVVRIEPALWAGQTVREGETPGLAGIGEALPPTQGPRAPRSGAAAPGYGVDAGMGCFFDAAGVIADDVAEPWLRATEKNSVDTWTWHTAPLGEANIVLFSSGFGDGFYASYWALAADGSVVALVTDFEVLLEAETTLVELPLPLPRGGASHPVLAAHDVTVRGALLSRTTAIVGGKGGARVELPSGAPVTLAWKLGERHFTWARTADTHVRIHVVTGTRALARAPAS